MSTKFLNFIKTDVPINFLLAQMAGENKELFLVGSRALDTDTIKVSNSESDFDYICSINLVYALKSTNKEKFEIKDSEYYNGIKLVYEGDHINLIPVIHYEYCAWKFATLALQLLLQQDKQIAKALQSKCMRIALTEQMRANYKSAMAYAQDTPDTNQNLSKKLDDLPF